MDLGPARSADHPVGSTLPEATWVEPIPDGSVLPAGADPADVAVARDSVRLAFVATLQHLPPRQRAVLILREVLSWRASEVAELLDTTVASVNSALQRARATLATADLGRHEEPLDDRQQALLDRYVDAFERYDMDTLTALLHEDATQSMPPFDMWLRGREEILRFWLGQGSGCRGSQLVPTAANGSPAFAQYKPSGPGGALQPWALQVLRISGDRIVEIASFLSTDTLFPLFGLPQQPPVRSA
jgi:RNA polymerase sigma-70 factor, ECF subfamily